MWKVGDAKCEPPHPQAQQQAGQIFSSYRDPLAEAADPLLAPWDQYNLIYALLWNSFLAYDQNRGFSSDLLHHFFSPDLERQGSLWFSDFHSVKRLGILSTARSSIALGRIIMPGARKDIIWWGPSGSFLCCHLDLLSFHFCCSLLSWITM